MERHNTSVLLVLFSFPLGRMQLKTNEVHVENPVQRTQVVPNRLQKENGSACSFQQ